MKPTVDMFVKPSECGEENRMERHTEEAPVVSVTQPIQLVLKDTGSKSPRAIWLGVGALVSLLTVIVVLAVLTYARVSESERDMPRRAEDSMPLNSNDPSEWDENVSDRRIVKRSTGADCITDCTGRANDTYQSYNDCDVYASCLEFSVHTEQFWFLDADCITDCAGRTNGTYQSCNGCDVYASCWDFVLFDDRLCNAGLFWDDSTKQCEYVSTTCTDGNTPSTTPGPGDCITTCVGIQDGDYQSCTGCAVYASCGGGTLYDERPCIAGLVWDDAVKECIDTSTTCVP